MKIFKLMMVAFVAMIGLNSCSKDCDHDFIDHDHSADLVGTWTCRTADFAEALTIKADGTAVSTGYDGAYYWENVTGNIVVKNGNVTMTFEDDDNFEGHFDIVPGVAFSIYDKDGEHYTYNYCANDLADEIIGMWVSNDGPMDYENDMVIQTYKEDGYTIKTGWSDGANDFIVNNTTTYKVVGDLVFFKRPSDMVTEEITPYVASRLIYTPNGTSLGDVLTVTGYIPSDKGLVEVTGNFLRVKQHLDLPGKKYDYSSVYISNVKGSDFTIMDYTFDASMADGSRLDGMLKHLLFCVEFPTANTIKYKYRYNDKDVPFEAPIAVDGNKVTIDMTVINSAYRKVEMYMFQDVNNSQLHMYIPTSGFINYFGNMQLTALNAEGKIDLSDADAVEKVFADLDACVESINLSLVMKARK